jgi:hypothetical protein
MKTVLIVLAVVSAYIVLFSMIRQSAEADERAERMFESLRFKSMFEVANTCHE